MSPSARGEDYGIPPPKLSDEREMMFIPLSIRELMK
jgi:hypothetical protein